MGTSFAIVVVLAVLHGCITHNAKAQDSDDATPFNIGDNATEDVGGNDDIDDGNRSDDDDDDDDSSNDLEESFGKQKPHIFAVFRLSKRTPHGHHHPHNRTSPPQLQTGKRSIRLKKLQGPFAKRQLPPPHRPPCNKTSSSPQPPGLPPPGPPPPGPPAPGPPPSGPPAPGPPPSGPLAPGPPPSGPSPRGPPAPVVRRSMMLTKLKRAASLVKRGPCVSTPPPPPAQGKRSMGFVYAESNVSDGSEFDNIAMNSELIKRQPPLPPSPPAIPLPAPNLPPHFPHRPPFALPHPPCNTTSTTPAPVG